MPVTAPLDPSSASLAQAWTRLCHLLDDDPQVGLAVVGTVGGDGEPWAMLLDELDDGGSLAYLDSSDTGDLLVDALAALPRVARTGVDLRAVCDVDELAPAVAAAQERLAAHGLALVALDEGDDDADSCPIVAVGCEHVVEIEALVARVGQRLLALD